MRKQLDLSFLILFTVVSQVIANLSEEDINESLKILVRKKRIIDNRPGENRPVPIEDVRHMANVERNGINICGAAILTANLIITAAQCVDGYQRATYTVRTGSAHVKQGQLHKVNLIIPHPDFHPRAYESDLALLVIEPHIDFIHSPSRPIALPTHQVQAGTPATISGWGCAKRKCPLGCIGGPKTTYPKKLRSITVHTTSLHACRPGLSDKFICTRDPDRNVFVKCGTGDAGGALVANNELIGIHVLASLPDVHINIFHSDYIRWMKKHIHKHDPRIPHNPHHQSNPTNLPNSLNSPKSSNLNNPHTPHNHHNPKNPTNLPNSLNPLNSPNPNMPPDPRNQHNQNNQFHRNSQYNPNNQYNPRNLNNQYKPRNLNNQYYTNFPQSYTIETTIDIFHKKSIPRE